MDNFDKELNELLGGGFEKKKPTLEELLAKFRKDEEHAKNEAAKIELEIKHRQECEEAAAAAAKEREIVLRYVPHQPGSVKIVKGEEFVEPNKPDNVVALLDAAAHIMAKTEGMNQLALTNSLLKALMSSMEAQILLKGLFGNDD